MPVLTDTLADEIKGLTASMHGMREDFAGWKGAVETELHLIRTLGKWILAAFTSIAIVALTGGAGLIWQGGALSAEVRLHAVQLEKRVDKLEGKMDSLSAEVRLNAVQLEKHVDKLEGKIDRVQEQAEKRMDKLEGKIDRVQEQVSQIDKRFDRLEAKLDQVLKAK
jgi:chaperonin cofactor prefoldin